MNQVMTAQQIAGEFYQQSNGKDMTLTTKQLDWLDRAAQEQRSLARGDIDTTSVVVDGRTVASYDILPVVCGAKDRRWKMVFRIPSLLRSQQ